jgi:MFS transporter, YNFM family, putative membrane transport protein
VKRHSGRPRRSTGTLRLLQLCSFTSSFDRFLVAPLILVIAVDLGEPIAAATLVATVYFQAYGVMQAAWAVVSDRLGRVRTIRAALLLASLAGLASAAAPDLGWLLVFRALCGASFAAAVPGAMMYVGDTVPSEVRHGPLTDLMSGAALGIALATLSAGVIGDHLHWRVAFALPALAAGALAVLMRRVPEPTAVVRMPIRRSFKTVLRHRWALVVLGLAFGEGLVLIGLLTFLPVTLQSNGFSTTAAGAITAVYGAAVLIFARVVRRLSRILSAATLIAVGSSCGVLAYCVLIVDQRAVGVMGGSILVGAAWAFMHSTLQAWVTEVVPEARATAVSLFASLLFTGAAVASALGSGLVEAERFRPLFVIGLAVMVGIAVAATTSRHRYAAVAGED